MFVGGLLLAAPFWLDVDRPDRDRRALNRLDGNVTHVRDGDTIEVSGVAVRIANLDCAETGTSAGALATDRMRALARAGPMACRLSGRKSYDREVGTCALADGRDVGRILIDEGVCRRWQ